jgi:hypothetical protein
MSVLENNMLSILNDTTYYCFREFVCFVHMILQCWAGHMKFKFFIHPIFDGMSHGRLTMDDPGISTPAPTETDLRGKGYLLRKRNSTR